MANGNCSTWGDPKTLRVRQSLMGETPKTTLTHRTASETSPSLALKIQNRNRRSLVKVMLRHNHAGHLSVYVPKKDLEEEVVGDTVTEDGRVLTLSNGWELAFSLSDLSDPIKLPQTLDARKL
jgi:nitrogen fixation protein NifT